MPFIPHTVADITEMLQTIGVHSIENLFDEIPATLRDAHLEKLPAGISEMELNRLMQARAAQDEMALCFIGAGAYEHHIPAAVWEVATRGEFMTAYTPYQAEASQGSLQLIYEYQTMMASLMGMEVSNASLYDGGSALAEAILMAVRLQAKADKRHILLPTSVHPFYRQAAQSIVQQQNIRLIDVPYNSETGITEITALERLITSETAALVIPQPNFFGALEEVNQLTRLAEAHQLLTIGVVNPMAMALLKPPGQWGDKGTDIACGEGQALGIPLSSGGPYYGFLCTKKAHVRQMPGRIVGRTVDRHGRTGYVLTLQAREQHIRRAKATSNICTNQGLMVTASTIYMSLLGPQGLRQIALHSHARTEEMLHALTALPLVQKRFNAPFFHEIVLQFSEPPSLMLQQLAKLGIQGGYNLSHTYPELENCLLLCATETKTAADIKQLAQAFAKILQPPLLKKGDLTCPL